MSIVADAVQRVFRGGSEVFIPCTDKNNQESVRTMTFAVKKRLPSRYAEEIGISKVKDEFGNLFVKVYKKAVTGLMERDKETGMLVPVKELDEQRSEEIDKERMVMLMRKDGKNEEEIKEALGG